MRETALTKPTSRKEKNGLAVNRLPAERTNLLAVDTKAGQETFLGSV
jgi:hypothetical protein